MSEFSSFAGKQTPLHERSSLSRREKRTCTHSSSSSVECRSQRQTETERVCLPGTCPLPGSQLRRAAISADSTLSPSSSRKICKSIQSMAVKTTSKKWFGSCSKDTQDSMHHAWCFKFTLYRGLISLLWLHPCHQKCLFPHGVCSYLSNSSTSKLGSVDECQNVFCFSLSSFSVDKQFIFILNYATLFGTWLCPVQQFLF